MPKEIKRKKATSSKEISVEEYLKQLPSPPEEHAYELKMEKRLKRLIEEQEKTSWMQSTTMNHRNQNNFLSVFNLSLKPL